MGRRKESQTGAIARAYKHMAKLTYLYLYLYHCPLHLFQDYLARTYARDVFRVLA